MYSQFELLGCIANLVSSWYICQVVDEYCDFAVIIDNCSNFLQTVPLVYVVNYNIALL